MLLYTKKAVPLNQSNEQLPQLFYLELVRHEHTNEQKYQAGLEES